MLKWWTNLVALVGGGSERETPMSRLLVSACLVDGLQDQFGVDLVLTQVRQGVHLTHRVVKLKAQCDSFTKRNTTAWFVLGGAREFTDRYSFGFET